MRSHHFWYSLYIKLIFFDFFAASIVQAISGLPAIFFIFFLGIIFSIASSLAFCQNVKIDFKIENQNSITKYLDDKKVEYTLDDIAILRDIKVFGDYGKMMLVLGDGFVTYDEWKEEEKFFASYTETKNDYDVKDLYSIKNYKTEEKEGFAEALKKLMNR